MGSTRQRFYFSLCTSAVHIEMLSNPQFVLSLLYPLAAPASALYPATAARQGGSVAASLVSSANIRLPHTRNLPAQRQTTHCPVHILTHR